MLMDASSAVPLFRMEGVSKRYGGVNALTKADLIVEAGHIHGVLGENGAGKSTLMKIMSGVVQPNEGRMTLDGKESDNFFVGNSFPTCGINFSATEIMGQSEANE